MTIERSGGPGSTPPTEKISKAQSEPRSVDRPSAAAGETDRIELSPRSREIARLIEAARNLPAVRNDRVAEIREQIQSGTGGPSSRTVARSMVDADVL